MLCFLSYLFGVWAHTHPGVLRTLGSRDQAGVPHAHNLHASTFAAGNQRMNVIELWQY